MSINILSASVKSQNSREGGSSLHSKGETEAQEGDGRQI